MHYLSSAFLSDLRDAWHSLALVVLTPILVPSNAQGSFSNLLAIAILISKIYFCHWKKKKKNYVPHASTKIYLVNTAMVTPSKKWF